MEAPSVRLSRFYPAPPETVFKAWTDPKLIAKWFAPSFEYTALVHQFDAIPGGRYRIEMRHLMGASHIVRGEFLTLNAPHRLEMSFALEGGMMGEMGGSRVTIDLASQDGGTMMTFVHDGFESFEAAKNHEMGWTGSLGRLRGILGFDPTSHMAATLAHHTLLFNNVLDGMSDEHLLERVGQANQPIWIAAHVANARAGMAALLGENVETPLAAFSGQPMEGTPMPSRDAILEAFGQAKVALYRGLSRATPQSLASAAPPGAPFDAPTIGEVIDVLVSHEAYHIGQLGMLRRAFGYPAMSYEAREAEAA